MVEIKGPNGGTVQKQGFTIDGERFIGSIVVDNPELWWPHTHGKQPRYEIRLDLLSTNQVRSSICTSAMRSSES